MSTSSFDNDDEGFLVLVNANGQFSLWPHWKPIPAGWRKADDRGATERNEAIERVESTWKDMRPQSLRRAASD